MLLSKHASNRLILSLKGPSHIVNPLPVCSQQLGAETIFNRFLTFFKVFHLVKYCHIYNYITLKVFSILKYVIIFKDEFICAIKHFSLSCLIFYISALRFSFFCFTHYIMTIYTRDFSVHFCSLFIILWWPLGMHWVRFIFRGQGKTGKSIKLNFNRLK